MSYGRGARKRTKGRVVIQGRTPGGSGWASAVAELTQLEARSLCKSVMTRSSQEQAAALRAHRKLRELVLRML